MSDESLKTKNTHEISIALIQKDIQYMRESVTKIEGAFLLLDKNFAKTEELAKLEKIVADMATAWEKKLDTKLDKSDFEPTRSLLRKINWLLISALIVGLLSLLIKSGS